MSKEDKDEIIISALVTTPTIRAAAEALDMSESQIYARLSDRLFRAKYAAARASILKAAESEAISKLSAAIDGIWTIATKPYQTDVMKLKAYETLINCSVKISDAAHTAERNAVADIKADKDQAEFDALFSPSHDAQAM